MREAGLPCYAVGKRKTGAWEAHALPCRETVLWCFALQSWTVWPEVTVGLSGYLNAFGESGTWV